MLIQTKNFPQKISRPFACAADDMVIAFHVVLKITFKSSY